MVRNVTWYLNTGVADFRAEPGGIPPRATHKRMLAVWHLHGQTVCSLNLTATTFFQRTTAPRSYRLHYPCRAYAAPFPLPPHTPCPHTRTTPHPTRRCTCTATPSPPFPAPHLPTPLPPHTYTMGTPQLFGRAARHRWAAAPFRACRLPHLSHTPPPPPPPPVPSHVQTPIWEGDTGSWGRWEGTGNWNFKHLI